MGQAVEAPAAATAPDLRARASSWGTVFLPFGRHFAGRVDMLTRDRFKAIEPINSISPFSAVGDPDPAMLSLAESERANDRVRADVHKDFGTRLAQSGADYLVVDNSTALLWLREHNKRIYTVIGREESDLMDLLWNGDGADRSLAVKPWLGLTRRLRSAYDSFVDECLANFDSSRIVLVRSHVPRFWVADDGSIAPTTADPKEARLLEFLDRRFVKRTACHVSNTARSAFPRDQAWHNFDESLRVAIEDDLISLCSAQQDAGRRDRAGQITDEGESAADHVSRRLRANRPLDERWVHKYFARGGVSHDDLLALAYIRQKTDAYGPLVQDCVRAAVADARSLPRRETIRRFDRSLEALRNWRWCALPIPSGDVSTPQITVDCGRGVFYRYFSDGSLRLLVTSREADLDADAIVDGRVDITPLNLNAFLASWPVYLARGRKGITEAPGVVVSGVEELLDSCSWIDWAWVLDNETMLITPPGAVGPNFARLPVARTDLSFAFRPNTRLCTFAGGLMD